MTLYLFYPQKVSISYHFWNLLAFILDLNIGVDAIENADVSMTPNFEELVELPGSVNASGFAAARIHEVFLLKKEIMARKTQGFRRVFQTLPRHMRRRAASYNLKRLPIRLRSKAMEELMKDPQAAARRPSKPPCRRRRRRRCRIKDEFATRSGMLWLATHLWHAKRAYMGNMWGFQIALRLNEKCLHSCLKAALKRCLLYDMSYYGLIFLKRQEDADKLFSDLCRVNIDALKPDQVQKAILRTLDGTTIGPVLFFTDANFVKILGHPLIASFLRSYFKAHSLSFSDFTTKYSIFRLKGSQTLELVRSLGLETYNIEGSVVFRIMDSFISDSSKRFLETLNGEQSAASGSEFFAHQKDKTMIINQNCIVSLTPPGDCTERILIIPSTQSCAIWNALIFQKARFAALTEMNYVDRELGVPVFPDDWAHSILFAENNKVFASILEDDWNRKPPSKRNNLIRFNLNDAFQIKFEHPLPQLDVFILECNQRGHPEYNARVFIDSVSVGFVTSGFYSQSRGCSTAVATLLRDSALIGSTVKVQNMNGSTFNAQIVKDCSILHVNSLET